MVACMADGIFHRCTMTEQELIHHLALTMIPHVGSVQAHLLIQRFVDPQQIFNASLSTLRSIPGIGEHRARAIKNFSKMNAVVQELDYIRSSDIHVLVRGHQTYPSRLEHCIDAPHVLFYKGIGSVNAKRIVGIVGTRSPTPYGLQRTAELVRSISHADCIVVSGLAYGIDTAAHQASIDHGVQTIGVLGHGLDRMYPYSNRQLAARMLEQGGLLTEFTSGTKPDRQNFPKRNRIVAAVCDALVVVESGDKGGSMITASIANSYNKDVFAIPGRVNDSKSQGCNVLIREHRASLITSGHDLLTAMGWEEKDVRQTVVQRGLFVELEGPEKKVYDAVVENEPVSIDAISLLSELSVHQTAAVLLSLELQGLVAARPGKMYGAVCR